MHISTEKAFSRWQNFQKRALALRRADHRRMLVFSVFCAVLICVMLATHLSCASRPPIEETVTTGGGVPNSSSTPVVLKPELPPRDTNIEAAGDRVAEAITLLSQTKRRGTAQTTAHAQRAVNQASASLSRALRNPSRNKNIDPHLQDALRNLNLIERSIARGSVEDALRDLKTLDKRLDDLSVESPTPTPTPFETTPAPNAAPTRDASPQPSSKGSPQASTSAHSKN
jgi:hypothetical protein